MSAQGGAGQEGRRALADLIGRVDKKTSGEETVQRLVEEIGSIKSIYEMNRSDLQTDHGVSRTVSEVIDIIDDLTRCVMRDEARNAKDMRRAKDAAAYFEALMYGRHVEYCYLMLLNARGKMIACPQMQRGTIDRSAVYVRELAVTALRARAKYAVLSHNHPGGSLDPSQADVQVTHAAMEALNTIGVILLDHIIVTGEKFTSIRKCGTPAERIWMSQGKEDKILKQWLCDNEKK